MVWKSVLILICFFGGAFAEDEEIENHNSCFAHQELYVSLGAYCEMAAKLRDNHLRHAAFPFDWLFSLDQEGFIAMLDEDFSSFFDERYLRPTPLEALFIENTHYALEFRHDFPSDHTNEAGRWERQRDEMRPKYERRIARFRQIRDYKGKVFFLRIAMHGVDTFKGYQPPETIDAKKAEDLRDALVRYFPGVDFTLAIIHFEDQEDIPTIEGKDQIVSFQLRRDKAEDYQMMFKTLQVQQRLQELNASTKSLLN